MIKNKEVIIPENFKSFFNLTTFPSLTSATKILLPGLKHIPVPKDVSDYTIMEAFNRFKDSTYWKLFFCRQNQILNPENEIDFEQFNPKLVNKFNRKRVPFTRLTGLYSVNKQQMKNLENSIRNWMQQNPAKKRNSNETKQIKQLLLKFPSVIFKAADKNIGIVALDISHYNYLVMQHLSNPNNYTLAASHVFQERTLTDQVRGAYFSLQQQYNFSPQQLKYIKSWPYDKFTYPTFHVLPKLHKNGPLKGRPIAGALNWFTTPISTILDIELQPALMEFPHILKNSQQLVQELEEFNRQELIPENYFIITGDVNSLYPSINQERLINIFNHLGNNRFIHLSTLVKFLLNNAYVKYNGKIFLQKDGIPMGTNAAVSLANIYMGSIDQYLSSRPSCKYYRRYIDDLFLVWTGTIEEWNIVAGHSNQIIPGITIEWQDPSTKQVFLDLDIFKDSFSNKLQTSPYQKPLNKYLYISPKSSHDRHTFKGFIKGELTRYARLSSSPFSYQRTKELFYKRLLNRGYPRHFLLPIFSNHKWTSRLYKRPPMPYKILPFIIPFTFRNNQQDLKDTLYYHGEQLAEELIPYSKPMFIYSKSKSIGSYLCKSAITRYHSQYLAQNPELQQNW